MLKRVWLLGALLAALGCGSDPCEEASEKLCARACECGNGDCAFGDMTGSISFESRSDCEILFKFACEQEGAGDNIDWDQCIADTEAGQCAGDAFPTPDSCEEQ
ncbi:MAG: hypothetical protein KJO07_19670 [Deltaproteobacteria bacterium]|nr:hypothetical protein [Deltaproteobacteria bacterium]